MTASQDTEITLGTGKLLGLFFGLAIVCALFFGFGYTLGHGSSKQVGSIVGQEGMSTATMPTTGNKPGATGAKMASDKAPDCAAGTDCSTTAANDQQGTNSDMSFYKSVEQKDAPTQLDKPSEAQRNAAPEMRGSASGNSSLGTGFMVQVAAVSKKEDADLLKSVLQGKQYPVVITSLPNDRLFHVQVGPFAEMKEAEAMKARLTNDGYTPILKR